MKWFPPSISIVFVLLVWAIFTPSASAIEHPRGYGDICFSCHDTILTEKETGSKLGRCSCHTIDVDDFATSKKDENKLSSIHEHLCAKCHAGLSYTPEDFERIVHFPHNTLECSGCHGGGNVTIPAAETCYDCHTKDVHEVHKAVIGEICIGCHGKAINKFSELKEGKAIVVKTPEEEPRGFSLYDLLKFLFPLVFGEST